MKVCLANDSFPPQIDGVSNTIKNYARIITAQHGEAIVATPSYKYNEDDKYPFDIVRYPSIPLWKSVGYNAGYPFDGKAIKKLQNFRPDIIHSHCPMVSQYLCRELRCVTKAPLVFTYHTKFDVDIKKCLKLKLLQDAVIDMMVSNIQAADEVWVVSKGAGDNLKSMGYKGDVIVMPNGVDIKRLPPDEKTVGELRKTYGLTNPELPVFLSVGRLKWYKGHRITIDALRKVKSAGFDFKMVFVGCGSDEDDIKRYVSESGLDENCIFTGPILDRELLRNHYFLGDIFTFPSTYDTNGIVVREAAACNLGAILVRDSCASEDVTDLRNGILIDENADSMAAALINVCKNRSFAKEIGINAGNELYLSWEDSVAGAVLRYKEIIRRGIVTEKARFKVDSSAIEFTANTYKAMEKLKAIFSDND